MKISRTKNSIKNSMIALICQSLLILLKFSVQTVFVKMLTKEYLGVNGLFANILTILSFTELGIGNAIIFSMYKPIANNDNEKVKSLMQLYKKAYTIIGMIILVLGLMIIPFMDFFIKERPNINESLTFIYILFLINSVISYFFTYKKSIISAYQKEYIITINNLVFNIIRAIVQIGILLLTHNYILYLIVQIIATFAENLMISIKANKMYPYLKDKNIEKISDGETKGIFSNVKHLFIYKIGSVILSGTDNIIISKIIGLVEVGLYYNYNLIINSVNTVINNAISSITSSIGNLNATGDIEKSEEIFFQIFLISVWIYGFLSIALLILINPFIEIWLGTDYLLNYITVLAIVLSFYVDGIRFAGYTYRTTLGLFEKSRYVPIIAAIINIILSIVLGKIMGISGIFFATAISRLITTTWNDPYLIYKYKFKKSPRKFFKKYIIYFIIVILNYIICNLLLNLVNINGLVGLITKGIICTIICNFVFLIAFFKTKEFKEIYIRFKQIIERKNRD